jgi:hypothetical protein
MSSRMDWIFQFEKAGKINYCLVEYYQLLMINIIQHRRQSITFNYLLFQFNIIYTVNIFLARNGRTRAVKFRPKNFWRISFDLGEISPNQQILRLSNGRNSPKMGEFHPKFLRANLNCADSPISKKFRPKKNYCVYTA